MCVCATPRGCEHGKMRMWAEGVRDRGEGWRTLFNLSFIEHSSPSPTCSSSAGASSSTTSSTLAAAGGEVVPAAAGGNGQQAHRRGQRCDGRTWIILHDPMHLVHRDYFLVSVVPLRPTMYLSKAARVPCCQLMISPTTIAVSACPP